MKKTFKKMNNTLFDLTAGPVFLVALGAPVLIVIFVIIIIIVSVILIRKAMKKNKNNLNEDASIEKDKKNK